MSTFKFKPEAGRRGLAYVGLPLLALGSAVGCTPYATFKPGPTSCAPQDGSTSTEAAYEFRDIDTFEGETSSNFFASSDDTPNSLMTLTLGTPPIGAPCGSTSALDIQSTGSYDWGSLTGYSNFGPRDGSAYEGLSFWAYAVGDSNKSLTILFDDANTYNGGTVVMDGGIIPPNPPTANCTGYPTIDGGNAGGGSVVDPATGGGSVIGDGDGPAPAQRVRQQLPDGDGGARPMAAGHHSVRPVPTGEYTEPGSQRRAHDGGHRVRDQAPHVQVDDLHVAVSEGGRASTSGSDNIAFYRHKGWMPPVGDGGVGAAPM